MSSQTFDIKSSNKPSGFIKAQIMGIKKNTHKSICAFLGRSFLADITFKMIKSKR